MEGPAGLCQSLDLNLEFCLAQIRLQSLKVLRGARGSTIDIYSSAD